MTNINKTVDSLLTLFEQYEATSVQTEQILKQLFRIIRPRIRSMSDDEGNRELIFKILDAILEHIYPTGLGERSTKFNVYFVNYLYSRLELFLELAASGKYSHDSQLWNIISILGMYLLYKHYSVICNGSLSLPYTF